MSQGEALCRVGIGGLISQALPGRPTPGFICRLFSSWDRTVWARQKQQKRKRKRKQKQKQKQGMRSAVWLRGPCPPTIAGHAASTSL
ncbi:hypothetical protein A7D01_04715 [Xanthomonas arboricola]|nr:hypothetical protein A7D01_04715 [Xanthomonas arboricola]